MKQKNREVCMIVAIDQTNGIGAKGDLLCHLSSDLKRFKELTTGHTIIMGRKTFESFPKGALPNRRNIVITHQEEAKFLNAETANSLEEALELCPEGKIFFIGGASIYRKVLKYTDTVYLTEICHTFEEADSFFPEVEWHKEWDLETMDKFPADEKNDYPTIFRIYKKKAEEAITRKEATKLGWTPQWGFWMELKHGLMGCFPLISTTEKNSRGYYKLIICAKREDLKKFWEAFPPCEVKVRHELFLVNPERTQCVSAENDEGVSNEFIYIDALTGTEELTDIARYAGGLLSFKDQSTATFPENEA
ncbi:MAG: dihydrofolate reductase [Candidatus Peribacteria bacterium]|jgi:dihydrofolate reductase|nr:dihydrofolate reductase [Candidatus Peribacteria bacterium]